jgi:hypothetical protein
MLTLAPKNATVGGQVGMFFKFVDIETFIA